MRKYLPLACLLMLVVIAFGLYHYTTGETANTAILNTPAVETITPEQPGTKAPTTTEATPTAPIPSIGDQPAVVIRPLEGDSITVSNILSLINQDRADRQLVLLRTNAKLTAAAQAKADDMATNGYFGHLNPNTGQRVAFWLGRAGYNYNLAGEILAEGYTSVITQNTAWLDSPSHNAVITNPVYREIGIATASGMLNGQQVTFAVAMFGLPKN